MKGGGHTLVEIIESIVLEQTKYHRVYLGQVLINTDPFGGGKVQVSVPELGWNTPDVAPWCAPRGGHSISVPIPSAWVEVRFIGGNPDLPVYDNIAKEMLAQMPLAYNKVPTTHVVFESPLAKQSIVVDDILQAITFSANLLVMLGGKVSPEPFIKGASFLSQLTIELTKLSAVYAAMQAWVPVPGDGGAALKAALTAPLNLPQGVFPPTLSTHIFGR